jgi:hypothetical protein
MSSTPSAQKLRSIFETLYLGCHGNAPRVADTSDRDRKLGDNGRAQTHAMAAQFQGRAPLDIVFASPFPRAQETAAIVTGFPSDQIAVLNSLDISDDPKEPVNVMFEKLMYSPLREYFKHELGEELKTWARNALSDLVDQMSLLNADRASVFVGGHAVCHPALAWAIGEAFAADGIATGELLQEEMLDVNLGEAAVIEIRFGAQVIAAQVISPEMPAAT